MVTSPTVQTAERINGRRLPVAALAGGVIAAVANSIVLLIAQAAVGPLMVTVPGMPEQAISIGAIFFSCILPAFIAAGLLWALGRFTQRPIRTFTIIAVVALVLSFASPFTAQMTGGTRVVLEIMHVIAAVAIIGALTRMARA